MGLYRWSAAATVFAAAAIAMLVFVDWPWAWPFIVTSWICSYMQMRGPLANRKRMRREAKAANIIRRAHEQMPVTAGYLSKRRTHGRREFDPFCSCPGCGLAAYHVLGEPRELQGLHQLHAYGDAIISVWNSPGIRKVYAEETQATAPLMVVDRECLSCRSEWTEAVS